MAGEPSCLYMAMSDAATPVSSASQPVDRMERSHCKALLHGVKMKMHMATECIAVFSEGLELIGVRGCRALRQALGVAGVRALDRLLQVRMADGVQQLSTALSSANDGRHVPLSIFSENLGAAQDVLAF